MDNKENGLNINTPTAVIIAGLIIAAAIIYSNSPKSGGAGSASLGQPNGSPQEQKVDLAPITDKDHFYGNPRAKVVMVEFSDTECPFCKRFHPFLKNVVDNSRGQVAWVYRHFPLDKPGPDGRALHPKAGNEAQATECASELGGNDKFWEYIGEVFAVTPSNNGLDPAELPKIAERVGLDKSKFNACLSSGKYKNLVEANFEDGVKAGVNGTPTTFLLNLKGQRETVVGADEQSLNTALDKLLK